MFCTGCGRQAGHTDLYCADCGRRLAVDAPGLPASRSAAHPPGQLVDGRLSLIASGTALAAAMAIVAALFPTYADRGAPAVGFTLHDNPGTLAYNLLFIAVLFIAALLAAFGRTARFGLGMVTSSGLLFVAVLIGDIGDALRSGDKHTDAYYAPEAGFYWGITGAVLGAAAASVAVAALRRSKDLSPSPTRISALWAVTGTALAGAWILGTWWPWTQNKVTLNVNGSVQTLDFNPCCSVSDERWQWIAKPIAVAVLLAVFAIVAACLRSASVAAGLLLAGAAFSAGEVLVVLFHKPYTLDQVANAYHVTLMTLNESSPTVRLEVLPGAWIAAAASAGFLLLAVGRGIQAAASPQLSVAAPPAVMPLPAQAAVREAPAQPGS